MLADGLEFKDAILGTQHNPLTNIKKKKKSWKDLSLQT